MATATGSRALRAAVGPGTVLAGRYRLEEPQDPAVGDPAEASRWVAVDVVLARPVEVLILLAGGRRAAGGRALLDAAAAAGTVVSPALAQVYDAALEPVPAERGGRDAGTVDVAYVVSEAVRGRSLADALEQEGPLAPEEAAAVVLRAAQGLRTAHARGVAHGSVHPGTLRLLDDGGVRLLDTAVGAALTRQSRTAPPDPADDVRALVGCLYAALTGRWPEQDVDGPSAGLRPAPTTSGRDGRTCSPRQVRAGVPRGLEDVVVRGLSDDRAFPTAEALVTALHRAADADPAARAPAARPPRPRAIPDPVRRWLPLALVAALLLVVGTVSYSTGRSFGTVQREEGELGELEALVESTPSPVPGQSGPGQRLDLTAANVRVTAYDPPPGDDVENPGAVPNSIDSDPATAWDTERYDTSRFGGLKQGVGLLLDLGEPVPVRQVEVGLRPGTDVELRAGDALGASADDLPVVASVTDSEAVARLVPEGAVTARYFLVWLTRLPADGGRFRSGISELQVVRE